MPNHWATTLPLQFPLYIFVLRDYNRSKNGYSFSKINISMKLSISIIYLMIYRPNKQNISYSGNRNVYIDIKEFWALAIWVWFSKALERMWSKVQFRSGHFIPRRGSESPCRLEIPFSAYYAAKSPTNASFLLFFHANLLVYRYMYNNWKKNYLLCNRVNVGTFGQCRYNRTLSYFLNNFSATSVVTAMCNPGKSQ